MHKMSKIEFLVTVSIWVCMFFCNCTDILSKMWFSSVKKKKKKKTIIKMNKMVPKVLHVAVGHILCIFHVCLLFQCGPILIIDFKSSHKHVLKPCLKVKFVDGLSNDRPSPCEFQLFCSGNFVSCWMVGRKHLKFPTIWQICSSFRSLSWSSHTPLL